LARFIKAFESCTKPSLGIITWKKAACRQSTGVLLRQGKRRLGPPDEATIAVLKSIKDLERLDRLVDAIIDATSWQELLATA
jgi:hypothetical protein